MFLSSLLIQDPDFGFGESMDQFGTLIDNFMLEILNELELVLSDASSVFMTDAVILCGIMMLFYFFVKAYQMITGDAKVDLVPLIRPFVFFTIVVGWLGFINLLDVPLNSLDAQAKYAFNDQRALANEKFKERAKLQVEISQLVYNRTQRMKERSDGFDWTDFNIFNLDEIGETLENLLLEQIAQAQLLLQARVSVLVNKMIEAVVVGIFKACLYLLFYIRILLTTLLKLVGPIVFALSIIPAYRDLYLQWISKYVAVMLYGAFAYIAMLMAFIHVRLGINMDITNLSEIRDRGLTDDPDKLAEFYAMIAGSTMTNTGLLVALFVGVIGLLMVPLISTWILGSNSTTALTNRSVAAGGFLASKAYGRLRG